MNHSSKIAFVAAPLAAAVLSCGVKYGDPVGTGSAGSGGGVVGGVAGGGGARGGVAGGGGSGSAAAGTGGAAIPLPGALPEFCTADGWCGSNLALAGVWGSSAGDVWVVANRIGDNPAASAVLHWDGSRWTTVLGRSADYLGADLSDLDAVWGTGPSDV